MLHIMYAVYNACCIYAGELGILWAIQLDDALPISSRYYRGHRGVNAIIWSYTYFNSIASLMNCSFFFFFFFQVRWILWFIRGYWRCVYRVFKIYIRASLCPAFHHQCSFYIYEQLSDLACLEKSLCPRSTFISWHIHWIGYEFDMDNVTNCCSTRG